MAPLLAVTLGAVAVAAGRDASPAAAAIISISPPLHWQAAAQSDSVRCRLTQLAGSSSCSWHSYTPSVTSTQNQLPTAVVVVPIRAVAPPVQVDEIGSNGGITRPNGEQVTDAPHSP